MKFWWNFLGGFLIAFFLFQPMTQAAVVEADLTAKAGMVVDVKTGQVLASHDDRKRLPIASLSKLMVIYLTEQAVQNGKIKHDEVVHVSKEVADFSQDSQVANIPMTVNQGYTVEQLESAALIASANGAAIALADLVFGSQNNYYQAANQLLASWGIYNAQITSASGLSQGDMGPFKSDHLDDTVENKLSAREIALLSLRLAQDYPRILKITAQQSADFPDKAGQPSKMETTNPLVKSTNFKFQGLKTGLTPNDGFNVVGYTWLKGRPVITVILNADKETVVNDTEKMLKQVDTQTDLKQLNPTQQIHVKNAPAKASVVTVKPQKPLTVFAPKDELLTQQTLKVTDEHLAAPVAKGQVVAAQQVEFKDAKLDDYLQNRPILQYQTKRRVAVANPLQIMWDQLKEIVRHW